MKEKIKALQKAIEGFPQIPISLMEVCGTHTMSIARLGIKSLLPDHIKIISGPGCPVCVTSANDIKKAIELARHPEIIITTFGDMVRIPCEGESLQNFSNVKIIYSPLESLSICQEYPDKQVVFLGAGFETTAPIIASTILKAKELKIRNFSILVMHKIIPPALDLILSDPEDHIDGLILPGHVSVITGEQYYDFLKPFKVSGVITGFDGLQIMESLYLLIKSISQKSPLIFNHYPSVVTYKGNLEAQRRVSSVFTIGDANWRGIGNIPNSGLILKEIYKDFDATLKFQISEPNILPPKGCRCGEILMGKSSPDKCSFFGKRCTPATPIGPCMVSSEGTCASYYKYPRD